MMFNKNKFLVHSSAKVPFEKGPYLGKRFWYRHLCLNFVFYKNGHSKISIETKNGLVWNFSLGKVPHFEF